MAPSSGSYSAHVGQVLRQNALSHTPTNTTPAHPGPVNRPLPRRLPFLDLPSRYPPSGENSPALPVPSSNPVAALLLAASSVSWKRKAGWREWEAKAAVSVGAAVVSPKDLDTGRGYRGLLLVRRKLVRCDPDLRGTLHACCSLGRPGLLMTC